MIGEHITNIGLICKTKIDRAYRRESGIDLMSKMRINTRKKEISVIIRLRSNIEIISTGTKDVCMGKFHGKLSLWPEHSFIAYFILQGKGSIER